MKMTNRISFSLIITGIFAVLLAAVVLLAGYAFHSSENSYHYLILGITILVALLICFLSVNYLFKYLIQNKKEYVVGIANREDAISNDNSISKVDEDVIKWQKDKEDQIANLKMRAQYRREFIGNVSHELKTPIFNIQGYVLTLLDGGLDDPSINKKYLERTEDSINRMISIVEDLEDISQLESGILTLNIEKFNLTDIAKESMEQLEMKANKRNIKIDFRKKNDKNIYVKGDIKRIRQVFINLIDNAIKYGKKNGNIKVGLFDKDDYILCEITDDGNGISNESLSRIFERFYRADKDRARSSGGSGLGLAIVKHIIEAHRQKINVKSKIGTGSTFTFTLEKYKEES